MSNIWTPNAEQITWMIATYNIDPDTGRITNKRTGRSSDGTLLKMTRYRRVTMQCPEVGLNWKHVNAHRLAWILYYGESAPIALDHINNDRGDNSKANLRLATQSQNQHNRLKSVLYKGKAPLSRYKGVTKTAAGKWIAQIANGKQPMCLGRFDDELDAARAYNEAAIARYGEYALINNVPDAA